jgi:RNA-binding protein
MIASTWLMSLTNVGEIGEIMHLAKSGRLIVKLNAAGASIRAGELLVDGSGKRVGRIAELIGPVSAPYASVIPMTDRTSRLVGAKVFSGDYSGTSRSQGRGSGHRSR